MSHCHDEHCDHDHDDLPESGEQFLLYSKIDIDNVRCLNESEPDSGKSVIRPWNERLEDSKVSITKGCLLQYNLMGFFSSLKVMPMSS